MGKLQQGVNDLQTWCEQNGEFGQQLIQEFVGELEDGTPIKMSDISYGSQKRVKWRCKDEHEWYTGIRNRSILKHGCKCCAKYKVIQGINDLQTWCLNNGEFGQQLIQEWQGQLEDNTPIKIDEITRSSNKNVLWKCINGHKWFTSPNQRTYYRHRCPQCYGNISKIGINDLQTWCNQNGEWGQQLLSEWTGREENGGIINITEVSYGSNKSMIWKCYKGHEWCNTVKSRTQQSKCPICTGYTNKLEIGTNDLYTWCQQNGEWGQHIINEWTGKKEDKTNDIIDIANIARSSHKRMIWKCNQGHEWSAPINQRTIQETGCPYCVIQPEQGVNDLQTWCNQNGVFGQQLIKEWTGYLEDGTPIEINQIHYGSSNKRVKWKCEKGHEWCVAPLFRIKDKTGCPECSSAGTSYPEQFIYQALKQIFPETEHRKVVLKSKIKYGIEFDIGIPIKFENYNAICIEYSPTFWHKGKEERDQLKQQICKDYNVRLINIIEDSYDELEETWEPDYICIKRLKSNRDEILIKIVSYILQTLGHDIKEIDIEDIQKKAYEFSKQSNNDV